MPFNRKLQRRLGSLLGQAAILAKDSAQLNAVISAASNKANKQKVRLKETWDELMLMLKLLTHWVRRDYTDVSWKTIVMIVAAVVYFLNPFDLIPDFFIGGYIDDVSMIALVLASVHSEIEKFKEWL